MMSSLQHTKRKFRSFRGHPLPADHHIRFVREGGDDSSATPRVPPKAVLTTQDCVMRVDLSRKLQFPKEITSTNLRPDIVMWSSSTKTVLLIELTVLWEVGIEAAWERKRLKYADLAAECSYLIYIQSSPHLFFTA